MVEVNGLEPMASCVQGRRISQLSYTPISFTPKFETRNQNESFRVSIFVLRIFPHERAWWAWMEFEPIDLTAYQGSAL